MSFLSWVRSRLRRREEQRAFEERMARLAQRDVDDTIAEEDVRLVVALLETGAREAEGAGGKRAAGVVEEAR